MDLQGAFDATCRVLFGSELGKLPDFHDYFNEMVTPYQVKKSSVSGKDVMISNSFYPDDARFVSQEEISSVKFEPLNVNEIKDVDSLLAAVSERRVFCGNKLFGKNEGAAYVDNAIDCFNVTHSHNVRNVKYGAYLSYVREAENVFGIAPTPFIRNSIRCCEGFEFNRCFESYYSSQLSDTYFAVNCIGCQDCIFAFNLRSKRHVIGNLELPKEGYLPLKKKLLSEMADGLRKKKRLFSIADIAYHGRDRRKIPEEQIAYDGEVPREVEEAFRSASNIVLGKPRQDVKKYGAWLLERAMKIKKVKGAFGKPTYKVDLPVLRDLPADRMVAIAEGVEIASKPIEMKEGESPSLSELLSRVSKVAYFSVEIVDGQNLNCVDTPAVYGGSNVYKLWDTTRSKYSAYSTGVIQSEHIFGGYLRILDSQFCVNCYDITNCKRCFEVDGSYNASDSYFCHNCENVESCLFCYNAKSLKYAVCNTPVGKEEFLRIKKMVLEKINADLDSKASTKLCIFAKGNSGKKA